MSDQHRTDQVARVEHRDRRKTDPPAMQDYDYVRKSDTVTFEVLTKNIHDHSIECNDRISKQLDQWGKQFISWTVATYFFVAAVVVVGGATWAIRDSIEKVKDAIPITSEVVAKVNFTADKISSIENSLITKADSVNRYAVEKALKIIKLEQQK